MDTKRQSFEKMLQALVKLVDFFNAQHEGEVDFGNGIKLFPAEVHTLVVIDKKKNITVTELAQELKVSKPTVSERIRNLVKKDVVAKGKTTGNAKSVILILTPQGKQALVGHEAYHLKMYKLFEEYFKKDSKKKSEEFCKIFSQFLEIYKVFDTH